MLRINAVFELLRTPIGAATLCFMGFMMLSAAWAPDPADTLVSSVLLFCTLLFAMAMVSELSVRDILIGLAIGYCMIVLPSLAISPFAASFAPVNADSLGEADRLRGFANHPVSLAAICAMLMVCCAALMHYMPKRRHHPGRHHRPGAGDPDAVAVAHGAGRRAGFRLHLLAAGASGRFLADPDRRAGRHGHNADDRIRRAGKCPAEGNWSSWCRAPATSTSF